MSLATPLRVVSALDPAVFHDRTDPSRPEVAKYHETRDEALIPKITRPGMTPVIYRVRRLTRSEWHLSEGQTGLSLRREVALRFGLLKIEGHPNLEPQWGPVDKAINDAEADRLFECIGPDVMEEMGELILQETRCPKGSARSYRLPLSSLHALGRMPSEPRTAGESQGSAADSGSGKP